MILVKENIFVHTPLGEGVIIYVTTQSPHSNDIFTVGLKESGEIRHFESTQITLVKNHTIGINLDDKKPPLHEGSNPEKL